MRSIHESVRGLGGHASTPTGSNEVTSTSSDTQGFRSFEMFWVVTGTAGTFTNTNKLTLKLEHSDDNSTFTAVPLDDILSDSASAAAGVAHEITDGSANATRIVSAGYRGTKRYVRAKADRAAAGTPAVGVAMLGVGGHPDRRPVTPNVG